ncbi:hypothetical protein Bpfe_023462, partial [Biomphalaria pfeifferi]
MHQKGIRHDSTKCQDYEEKSNYAAGRNIVRNQLHIPFPTEGKAVEGVFTKSKSI